jgi:hypothetical protein
MVAGDSLLPLLQEVNKMTDKHNTTNTRNMILSGANKRHQTLKPRIGNGRGNNLNSEYCECGNIARLTWRNKVRVCVACFKEFIEAKQS